MRGKDALESGPWRDFIDMNTAGKPYVHEAVVQLLVLRTIQSRGTARSTWLVKQLRFSCFVVKPSFRVSDLLRSALVTQPGFKLPRKDAVS